jgi:hypothetical protein
MSREEEWNTDVVVVDGLLLASPPPAAAWEWKLMMPLPLKSSSAPPADDT